MLSVMRETRHWYKVDKSGLLGVWVVLVGELLVLVLELVTENTVEVDSDDIELATVVFGEGVIQDEDRVDETLVTCTDELLHVEVVEDRLLETESCPLTIKMTDNRGNSELVLMLAKRGWRLRILTGRFCIHPVGKEAREQGGHETHLDNGKKPPPFDHVVGSDTGTRLGDDGGLSGYL